MIKIKNTLGLSSNVLKIIGAVTMVIDHIGVFIFPDIMLFRIIGRISFPIFSYLICEGCKYTKNKTKYFLRLFILGVITSAVYFLVENKIYLSVVVTFSLSVVLIILLSNALRENDVKQKWLYLIAFFAAVVLIYAFTRFVEVDYGFEGVLLPVFSAAARIFDDKNDNKLLIAKAEFWAFAVGLSVLCLARGDVQFFSLFSLPLLALYNGKKGFNLPKYFFYIFYPTHFAVIWGIGVLIANV